MSENVDFATRERFARELDRNFSVIASAGSGKTRAITDRIVELARSAEALERLPQLVVVTYTNRAADEMQQRTRQRILEAGRPLEIIEAFNRAFFGTIHSFCVKLLAPARTASSACPRTWNSSTNDDEELWNQFVQQHTTIGRSLRRRESASPAPARARARHLMELARKCELNLSATEPDTPCPDADFTKVYSVVAGGCDETTPFRKTRRTCAAGKSAGARATNSSPGRLRSSNAKEFVRHWRDAFRPLRDWINACALCVAAEVQRAYRDFRFERGVITYRGPGRARGRADATGRIVARRIREKKYRVILDEAQDTDPATIPRPPRNRPAPGSSGTLAGNAASATAPGPFLHGGRFPAIDLSQPRRSRPLSRAARCC